MKPTHAIISYPKTKHECWHLGWLSADGSIYLSDKYGDSGAGEYTGTLPMAYATGDDLIMRDLAND